jgi:DNA-binding transcriptional regulator YiaG
LNLRFLPNVPLPRFSDAGGSDFITWLEVLRIRSGHFKFENGGIEGNADGSDGAEHLRGTLLRICSASAEYGHQLESKALDAEFRERQNAPQPEVTEVAEPLQVSAESVGHQINRYREECRMTVEELAEKMEVNTRSVQRQYR